MVLLALQAPVAGDLRAVVSALQHAADIERMGGPPHYCTPERRPARDTLAANETLRVARLHRGGS